MKSSIDVKVLARVVVLIAIGAGVGVGSHVWLGREEPLSPQAIRLQTRAVASARRQAEINRVFYTTSLVDYRIVPKELAEFEGEYRRVESGPRYFGPPGAQGWDLLYRP